MLFRSKEWDSDAAWQKSHFSSSGPFKSVAKDGRDHAVVLVGYDNARNAFKFINSWSNEWGEGGFGRIDYTAASTLWVELYTMRVGDGQAAAAIPPAPVVKAPPVAPGLRACSGPATGWNNCQGTLETSKGTKYTGEFRTGDRKSTRLNSSHVSESRMPSSA